MPKPVLCSVQKFYSEHFNIKYLRANFSHLARVYNPAGFLTNSRVRHLQPTNVACGAPTRLHGAYASVTVVVARACRRARPSWLRRPPLQRCSRRRRPLLPRTTDGIAHLGTDTELTLFVILYTQCVYVKSSSSDDKLNYLFICLFRHLNDLVLKTSYH